MNVESWTLLVEAVGALGIVITLGYLAIQVRQNNSHLAAQARWNLNQQRSSMMQSLWRDADVAELMDRAARHEALETVEQTRLYWLTAAIVNQWAYDWKEFSLGNLAKEDLPVARMIAAYSGRVPRMPEWWESSKSLYDAAFVEWVDENIVNG